MNKEKALSLAAAICSKKMNIAVGKSRKNWSNGKYLKKKSTGL